MKSLKFILIAIVLVFALSLSVIAFWYGQKTAKKEMEAPKIEVTSEIILDKITDQYFIVTKTLFFDEEITLTVDEGSDWTNLLWGEEIMAEGIVRVDVGVDMKDLTIEDIQIDDTTKTITVDIKDPEVLDASLTGEIKIETNKGIIKNIEDFFDEEEGEDYNKAVNEMIKQATNQVETREDILTEAKQDSTKLIKLVLQNLEYEVIFI